MHTTITSRRPTHGTAVKRHRTQRATAQFDLSSSARWLQSQIGDQPTTPQWRDTEHREPQHSQICLPQTTITSRRPTHDTAVKRHRTQRATAQSDLSSSNHNHKPETNPRHRSEETQNTESHSTIRSVFLKPQSQAGDQPTAPQWRDTEHREPQHNQICLPQTTITNRRPTHGTAVKRHRTQRATAQSDLSSATRWLQTIKGDKEPNHTTRTQQKPK